MPVRIAQKRAGFEFGAGLFALLGAALLLRPPSADELPAPKPEARAPSAPDRVERPGPPTLSASYTLEARLDAKAHRISASGTIDWLNTARVPVRSLFFHLYLNAFKNDHTLYLRSPFAAGRGGARATEFGYIDLKFLRARELGNVDLWPSRTRHSPGNPEDETDIEVPLPSELAPGARLTLDLKFDAQLPEIVERSGYADSFHFVAQWFPKLAKLEESGNFAHFAFHPQSEFYADFGRYDVTLDVPAGFTVGASGTRQSDTQAQGRRRVRYVAEPVHDFAWTAWDGFVEQRTRLGKVEVTLLTPRGHAATAHATLAAVGFALPYFSEKFGSYPYPTLTVVHPPDGAESAGGMEYPTLITTGAPWYAPYSGTRALEAVTVHELGHQWFYGILASNESKFPFLDEGLNSYAELSALRSRYGERSSLAFAGLSVDGYSLFRVFSAARGGDEAVGEAAAEFSGFRNLAALVYSRTATLMETVARVWGPERCQRALLAYAERYRFLHPQPADFLGVIRELVAPEAAEMLSVALFQRGSVDYLVRDVESASEEEPAGFFERPSGRERVTRSPERPTRAERYRGRATVYRHGALEIPVEVLLVSADGKRRVETWDGRGLLKTFEYAGTSPLTHAVIDPEHKVLIDDNLLNNQAAAHEGRLPRVHERLGYFAAVALGVAPVSAGLSVAHLRPRSSLGYVLLLNWLSRAVLGWLVAVPLIAAVGASGIGALPQADRALFEGGGLWLVELFYREAHALSAGLRAALPLACAALVLRVPLTALLFFATHDPKASLSVAFRRALASFRRFLGLSVLELLGRGLLIALTLLAARSFSSVSPHIANEALADLGPVLLGVLGLVLVALLAIFFECCRASGAASPKLPFGALLASATALVRSSGIELFASYLLYVGASALLLAGGARAVEALDVSRAGALRLLTVCLLHQGALLGLCVIQGAWVRRVVGLVQPGPDSPNALR